MPREHIDAPRPPSLPTTSKSRTSLQISCFLYTLVYNFGLFIVRWRLLLCAAQFADDGTADDEDPADDLRKEHHLA